MVEAVFRGVMTSNEIKVIDWRPLKKGTSLQGFASIQLPSGLILHDVSLHEHANGSRWVGLPARKYETPDCTSSYVRLIEFVVKDTHRRFQKSALAAVDKFFAEHSLAKSG